MAKIELPDVKDIFLEYRKMQLLYQSALKEIGTKLEILKMCIRDRHTGEDIRPLSLLYLPHSAMSFPE